MVKVTINGTQYEANKGETIIKIARREGISIPTFCYHEKLSIAANCRMCLVEVEGAPKLLPACQTEVRDGMVIYTESEKVKDWQKKNLEFILLHHPIDCPICDQAGDCKLQDFYEKYDSEKSRLWTFTKKLEKSKRKILGPHVIYDAERCILCTLCIRFCEEIWGEHLLDTINRGNRREITAGEGCTLDFPYSLMVVELCPVGAVTSRDFRFKKRCWFLKSKPTICPGCATGCAAVVDSDEGIIYRLRPRPDPEVNDCWLCDDGVLCGDPMHNQRRILKPMIKEEGKESEISFEQAYARAAEVVKGCINKSEKVAVVLSAERTCEENYSLMKFSSIFPDIELYLEGREEGEGDRLLRNKDKNPNRKGAIRVCGREKIGDEKALVSDIKSGKISAVILLGNYAPSPEVKENGIQVICFASRKGSGSEFANLVIPLPSFAETSGCYINYKGAMRRFEVSVEHYKPFPPQLWELLSSISSEAGTQIEMNKETIFTETAEKLGG